MVRATKPFEEDTATYEVIRKTNGYNTLLKDLPIVGLTTTNSIGNMTIHLKKIFEYLKSKIKIANYPCTRTYQLVEAISKDMNLHLLDILTTYKLFDMEYEDFHKIYKELRDLFSTWKNEYDITKREIMAWQKSKGEKHLQPTPKDFEHHNLENRILNFKRFRNDHNNLLESIRILNSTEVNERDSALSKELNQAFAVVANLNILDLSKEGEVTWNSNLNEYNKKTAKIENQISTFITDKLGSASNPNEQLRIFEKFTKLITRPRVQQNIQDYQNLIVNSITNNLKEVKDKIILGYNNNPNSSISRIRGIPEVSGQVIWLKQFQRKLNCYKEQLRLVLGDEWETHSEGKLAKDVIDKIMKLLTNSLKCVEVWSKDITTIDTYNNEKVFDVVSKNNNLELRVNFDEKVMDLFKEVRLIGNLNIYSVNAFIVSKAMDMRVIYPHAISVQDSIRTFNQICTKIKHENRISKLIAKSKKDIQDLIAQNINMNWGGGPKLEKFSKELSEKIASFEENVRDLVSKIDNIHSLFNQIMKAELSIEVIHEKVSCIQKIIDEIDNASNIQIWIAEMDNKLESILIKKLEEIINIWLKEFNSLGSIQNPILLKEYTVYNIKLKDQMIYLEPSINEAREYWYSQLHQALSIVCSAKRIEYRLEANFYKDNLFRETTYRSILKQLSVTVLKNCYQQLESKIEEASEYFKTWLSYQVLWDIQPRNIYDKLGDDMEKWQQLMNELKAGRKTFDNSESEKQFGAIIIDYSLVQTKINNKYDSWHKEIMTQFANTLNENIKSFYKIIYSARINLENNSLENVSTDIVTIITEIKESEKNLKTWQSDMDKYKNGKKILDKQRYHFPSDYCNVDQLDSEWSKLKQILSKKSKSMKEQIPAIQARILAEEKVILEKVKEIETFWNNKKPYKADSTIDAINVLNMAEGMVKRIKEDYVKNCRAKEMLEMEFSDPNKLDSLEEDIKDLKEVWLCLNSIWSKMEKYRDMPFVAVIPDRIKNELQETLNEMGLLPNKLRQYEAYDIIKSKLNNLKKINNIISDLRTDAIKDRHWKHILSILNIRKNINEMILGDFWNAQLQKNERNLNEIIRNAEGEMILENLFKNSKEFWLTYELEMVRYKDKCKLIKGWDDLFAKLDEHINSFVSMQNSPFFSVFKDEIEPWKEKLEKIRLLFNEWIDVQRRWVYLEGIFFGSADIMNELASDFNKFKSIDGEFTGLMKKVALKPMVLDVIGIPSIKSILEEKLKPYLERIQKSLYNFLEKQRQNFARFYFIGDEDLLEIVGNSKDIYKVQRHFNKMFAGLNSLNTPDGNELTHMVSREKEEVEFTNKIKISDDPTIYIWLEKIENQMRITLATKLERAVTEISSMDYVNNPDQFVKWIENYPAQITVLSSQVLWSASVESALNKKSLLPTIPDNFTLEDEEKIIGNQLSLLSDQVLNEISVDMRKKLEQLITELVHQRDVVRILRNTNLTSSNSFEWLYYMRYYFNPRNQETLKKLQIRMSNAPFDYGFEYLGVAEKLIQTPLTDRCYLTLTQALYFRMGGSPFGPAGTGKTESVKALGGQLGRFTLVFNCDETFDFKAMGRIFVGLCQVGAWGCFDEFNRLEEKILSAVSQQILIIQLGLRESSSQIDLMGKTIKLNHQMGAFVTMNPGYAGRSQLPDNLKQLFRQMAMVKPDKDMIAQVTLYSQGYKTAERLSGKMVSLFDLCSNQLSSQSHYDFGLRALKSVLINAGNLKRREEKIKKTSKVEINIEPWEQNILLKSVCDTLIPKLVAEDITLFHSLLVGVFPDAKVEEVKEDLLRSKIIELCKIRNLLPDDTFIDKIIQLYSIQNLHHGVMMVGQSGTGKSAAWKILLEALYLVDGIKGESYIIDPKAVNKDNLYGKLDQTTLDWTDGVFTGTLRKILDNQRGESCKRHWIIFDGDVDPEWAENLNSVLDDNKLLTLPHGDRLSIPSNVRIMFEVENLKHATLATVSRCGMVWFSEDIVSTNMIFNHYLMRMTQNAYDDVLNYNEYQKESSGNKIESSNKKNDENTSLRKKCVEAVRPYFINNGFADKALEISAKYNHIMEFSRIRVIESMFALLRKGTSNIIDYNENHSEFPLTEDQSINYIKKWLCLSLIWGFGGSLSLDLRTEFSNKLINLNSDIDFPLDINSNMALIDYEVRIADNSWAPWKKRVPNTDIDTNKVSDADVVITTVDTVRHQEILCSWISEHRPFILCGPPGSGKTMTLMATLKVLTDFEMVFINFSSSTTPDLILKTFDHYCEYKKLHQGTFLRPKQPNKWLVVFCDEINLPEIDKYSTQIVITFLREITEQNGFWRPSDKQWISLERIQFVGACNPPTDVGRHPLNNRFLRHCPLLYVDFPGKESLKQIYGTFNRALLRKAVPELRNCGENLTNAMVEFYTESQKHFTPDIQPHYIYSPRELTRWKHAINESIESMNSLDDLVRLWAHEALRLFQDRLVLKEEKEWCDNLVDSIANSSFRGITTKALEKPILFTNLMTKKYISCDPDELKKNIEGKLKTFYEEELNVPLVIFDDVLEHILRIDRVLKQPIGHLLLVGSSGVGKTTLSRFVAWMNNLTVFQIKAGRNYSVNDFDDDLRSIMKRSGCKGEKICFIFDESNVLGPAFLERMNALLASGEVPGLFEGEEYMNLINTAKEFMMKENKVLDSEEEIYKSFIKGVQRNLHVVFTMNPLSPDFSNRAASSPALYNRCVIDWFGDWSKDGLWQVCRKLTEHIELNTENFNIPRNNDPDRETMHNLIVNAITNFHVNVKDLNIKLMKGAKKFNYITPRDFLDFIRHFINIQKEKNDELNEQQAHINKGLSKINDTEEKVNEMKQNLIQKKLELADKNIEVNEKLDKIKKDSAYAIKKKEETEIERAQIEKYQLKIDEEERITMKELDELEPQLKSAEKLLENKDLQNFLLEMRNQKAYSPKSFIVFKILHSLYVFGNEKNASKIPNSMDNIVWDEIRKTLGKQDFIPKLREFSQNYKDIPKKLVNMIKADIGDKEKWDIDLIKKASLAAHSLANFVVPLINCSSKYTEVEPKREYLRSLKEEKKVKEDELMKKEEEIEKLNSNLKELEEGFKKSNRESDKIKTDMEEMEKKKERSEQLLNNLSSEKIRWGQEKNDFKKHIDNILGDTLLCSSFLAYIGFYDAFYRKALKESAKQILNSNDILFDNNIDEVDWLTKPNDKIIWQKHNLPVDNICLENAAILQRFNRYPLIIDPSGQATDFIRSFYSSKKLNSTSFNDQNFLKTLESGLRFGYPVLVQDVEKIDPIMNSLLNKEIHKTGGRNLIRIGDQEIDFSPTFNMFMITRDPSCQFTPDLCSRVTFLNFTITPSSLQNQILSIILKSERPEVEKKKEDLIKAQREFKLQLRQLEESLLQALNSEGNLLENDHVMTKLEDIKKKSQDISKEVLKTDEIMRELELTSNEYLPIANMASRIFFSMESLDNIHYLYKFSLGFFMDVLNSIIKSAKLEALPKTNYLQRQEFIIKELFMEIYHRVAFGLLNQDSLIFAMRLAQIRLGEKFKNEIKFVLKATSSGISNPDNIPEKILAGKLTLNQRRQIAEIMSLPLFENILADINENQYEWINFINEPIAENYIPCSFINFEKYTEEDRLLLKEICNIILLLIFRPDRTINSVRSFVKNVFDERFLSIPELDLTKIIEAETNCKSPILFCSAPGHDASNKIEQLARKLNKRFISIAIGSSEGFDLVEKNLPTKARAGEWLVLKNVHLAPSWLNELEKKLYSMEPESRFRLFLTMEFNPKIPSNVLRISRKIVFELPAGIKYSLIRSYSNVITPVKSERIPIERCKLHFLLAWFHAVIGERLRYVPIGWSKFYEFNESDQKCALDAIDEWLDIYAKDKQNIDPSKIPWDAIRIIISQSMYGGKIDNEYDLKILESLVKLYFNEKSFDLNYPLFKSSNAAVNILTVPEKRNKYII